MTLSRSERGGRPSIRGNDGPVPDDALRHRLEDFAIRRGLAPHEAEVPPRAGRGEAVDVDAIAEGFFADRHLGQERDALAVGHELDDGRERGGGEGPACLGVEVAGGHRLVAETVPLVEEQHAVGIEAREVDGIAGRLVERGRENELVRIERGD